MGVGYHITGMDMTMMDDPCLPVGCDPEIMAGSEILDEIQSRDTQFSRARIESHISSSASIHRVLLPVLLGT